MSQYQAAVPGDNLVKPEIRSYYESFYAISDTPDAHEKYAEQFTKDAKLIIASNEAVGRDGTSEGRDVRTHGCLLVLHAQVMLTCRLSHLGNTKGDVGEGREALPQTFQDILLWPRVR